jgi:HlyD family secretion protein
VTVRRPLVVVIALALLLAAGALAWQLHDSNHGDALTLYGNVDIREVELGFRVGGRLSEVAVEEGDHVRAGSTLARLDAQPLRDALAAARARLEQARANLEKLHRGSRPQEIAAARARVSEAQAGVDQAERDYTRQAALNAEGANSGKVLEAAQAQRDAARARLDSAREALALAVEGPRREDVAAGSAELDAAAAAAAQAQTALEDTTLLAPSDATVLSRAREPGSMLAPGAPVLTLSLRNPLYVRAYVSEPQLGRARPGTSVEVLTDSGTHPYHGQIGFVAPRAEFTPKSVETTDLRTDLVYRLRIVVTDADEGLRQGMPVTVRLGAAAPSTQAH